MVNVWAGEAAMCRVATECAGTWRGCAVITSILAHAKTQLNQAVRPYSFNVVERRGF